MSSNQFIGAGSMRDTSYKLQVSALHMNTSRSCHFAVQISQIGSLNFISVINER